LTSSLKWNITHKRDGIPDDDTSDIEEQVGQGNLVEGTRYQRQIER
jgi:hypothetical protein